MIKKYDLWDIENKKIIRFNLTLKEARKIMNEKNKISGRYVSIRIHKEGKND